MRNAYFAKGLAMTLIAIPLAGSVAADLPDAAQSDPVALGWMVGSPPPPDKTIRFADGSFYKFPQSRWTFSHWREIFPTRNVSRGEGPVSALPRGKAADLDGLTFTPMGSDKTMTWADSLGANSPTRSSCCTAGGSSTRSTSRSSPRTASTSLSR
jgi:hypothetical protein